MLDTMCSKVEKKNALKRTEVHMTYMRGRSTIMHHLCGTTLGYTHKTLGNAKDLNNNMGLR